MLLYFKGITSIFHDIDLMIANKDVESARKIPSETGELQKPDPNPRYKTKAFIEFVITSIDVDVMAGFAISNNGKTMTAH